MRTIKNKNGELPIDKIQADSPKADELRHILIEKFSFWTCLNIWQPLKKIERNEMTTFFFFLEFIVVMMLTGFFILPTNCTYEPDDPDKLWTFWPLTTFIGFATALILFFTLASFKNPGYVTRDGSIDFQDLLDKCNPLDMCPECKIIRTPRSWHCNICNMCVERFDHHCPYINNCVGYWNHTYFLLFILMIVVNLLYNATLTIWSLVIFVQDYEEFKKHKWSEFWGID